MNRKYVGYVLTILGIVLIAVGALNVAGYLSLQVVDTTPPKVIYTFPCDKMTYKPGELNEIIVYARDKSGISAVSYFDKYGQRALILTPYTQISHRLIMPSGQKYPDINTDGVVDNTDLSILNSTWGSSYGDSRYKSECDLNSDGIIDTGDYLILMDYYGITTFAVSVNTSVYSAKENITFSFSVLDEAGNLAVISGSFNIEDYEQLSGTWKINDKIVIDNMMIELSERKVNITFICEDTSISASSIAVKAIFPGTSHTLTYVGNYTWIGTIELSSEITNIVLEASTSTKLNKISVTIKIPESPAFTLGHALIFAGGILAIAGIIIVRKKEEVW